MNKKFTYIEPICFLLFMWTIYILSVITPFTFLNFGIIPRTLSGLIGIFTAPFVHASFYHIISNSIPFLILGMLVRTNGRIIFWQVTLVIIIIGGLIPWIFSSAGTIVGASGLIFGYWAFLLFNGIYTRSLKAIVIAIVVFVIYGTMVTTLFRYYPGISFSGHLGGAVGGFVAAYLLRLKLKTTSE